MKTTKKVKKSKKVTQKYQQIEVLQYYTTRGVFLEVLIEAEIRNIKTLMECFDQIYADSIGLGINSD